MPLPLLIALQFLTRLPVSLPGMPPPDEQGRSLLYYPLVGGLLGGLLWLASLGLADTPALLGAALLLSLWVLLSGALHLDGLGDCVDAWVGGYGERERTLVIMKDPRCGPMAVVALCLLLLLKCAALSVLLPAGQGVAVLLAVWLARSLLPLLFYCTPYVRAEGLGAALSRHLPRQTVPYLLAVQAGLCLLFGWAGVYALLAALGCFYLARRAMLQRLGGCTGDCAGALVELAELAILLVLALALG